MRPWSCRTALLLAIGIASGVLAQESSSSPNPLRHRRSRSPDLSSKKFDSKALAGKVVVLSFGGCQS
ncbi:MAG: hypothetical protein E6J62_12560 [Deltaproteobacteria bacterium]|nr:MAG: hypothetical protein E6J62_12560 [Deltaproteobacteria bacterium]